MAALQAALAKFRSRAVVASNVKEAGRKEREEKIQQKAAAEAKQTGRSCTFSVFFVATYSASSLHIAQIHCHTRTVTLHVTATPRDTKCDISESALCN